MNVKNSFRQLPSTAWQALKNYFAGLRLFFNRENWSHSIVFIITLGFFIILALIQQPLRLIFVDPITGVQPFIVNSIRVMVIAGCGAFLGFLILGLIAIFGPGQRLIFESRFRHAISPIVILSAVLFFVFLLPPLLIFFPNLTFFLFSPNGAFFTIFSWAWIIIIFLQVILLGYTIVKSIKWLAEYIGLPSKHIATKRNWVTLIIIFILIPILIWSWYPIVFSILINGMRPGPNPPNISLPPFVLWLLSLNPGEYVIYLMLIFPIVTIVAAIVLWQRLPSVSIALGSFGVLYPALVYYYRFRVNQYFINWSYLPNLAARPPFPNFGLFQIALLLLTFVFVFLGAAKLQRNVSPNPFGLFAIMIGTIVFVLFWVIIPDYTIGIGVEFFGMVGSALSAFLAVVVFVVLPLAYAIYRIRKVTPEPEDEPEEKPTPQRVSANMNQVTTDEQ